MPQRFRILGPDLAQDAATGLIWPRSANLLGFPLSWADALAAVANMNRDGLFGFHDWRMPNRVELRSLIDHARRQPALPAAHPFRDVFLGWCWTSTTKAGLPAYAWNVHLEGGRMFYSRKDEFRLLWPVRGESGVLPRTGQALCYDAEGGQLPCRGGALASGQDGALQQGVPWPEPRFEVLETGVLGAGILGAGAAGGDVAGSVAGDVAGTAGGDMAGDVAGSGVGAGHTGPWPAAGVRDRLTGLVWAHPAWLPAGPLDWAQAQELAAGWGGARGGAGWRLPEITELESLVDAQRADPALPLELLRLSGSGAPGATASGQVERTFGEAQGAFSAQDGEPVGVASARVAGARVEGVPIAGARVEGFWSATTSGFDAAWAFVLYVQKGAVGVGFKAGKEFFVWPVRRG